MMILRIRNIEKSFGRKKVLKGVSADLEAGGLYGIVGENGSGKSTLLKIITGLWKADAGEVTYTCQLGYCPQEALLFNQLTVSENFAYFAAAYGLKPKENWHRRRDQLLEHFQYSRYENEKVAHLSGGTLQKLNLSLALLHQPELLILDEPYAGFDWETYLRFWNYAAGFIQSGGTILIVTHLITDRERFDRIFNLENGILL